MLMADNGADVTRIERPDGDPFDAMLDYRIYNRGKRSAVLDLKDTADLETFLALAATADVLIESYSPGVTTRLGIDYDTLQALNPRLIYCSITGYGRDTRHAGRPAYDQLVAARTGYQWEVRAWPGSPADNVAGRDLFPPDTTIPAKERHWLDRNGPVFTSTPGASMSTGYLACLGISGALRARERTGRGQLVETSLLQGVLAYCGSSWQRTENKPDSTGRPAAMGPIMNFASGVTVMSGPWSFYECSDGRWVNNWTGRPEWAIIAGSGDELRQPREEELAEAMVETGGRGGTLEQQLRTRLDAIPIFKKFPQQAWVDLAAEAGHQAMQPVRSPEEVRLDDALMGEGSVVEIEDPKLGPIRQAGMLYRMFGTPGQVAASAPERGENTEDVRAEAATARSARSTATAVAAFAGGPSDGQPGGGGPLAGVKVLDFGLAVAGPWGGELLAQLGADVIKIDPPKQNMWLSTNMAMKVNRSKRHISLDIKTAEGKAAAYEMVRQADVVMMNMRPQAAIKLGIDYESLKKINPQIIHCRSRGFNDARAHLPGNDQTGNSLGGTVWEDGGVNRGGRPYWSAASGGDLGNGYMSAIAITQALYHRDRTGEGQQCDTSILNAALFGTAWVYTTPDGKRFDRPTLDPNLLGFHALYRLYECRDNTWLCLAVFNETEWSALTRTVPALAGDDRFASAEARTANDADLCALLEQHFQGDTAEGWFKVLDDNGVPCEVSSLAFSQQVLDDPELLERDWVVHREGHPLHGRMDMMGRFIDFSDTEAPILGPPDVPGQHSREILAEFGFTQDQIDAMAAAKVVFEAEV